MYVLNVESVGADHETPRQAKMRTMRKRRKGCW